MAHRDYKTILQGLLTGFLVEEDPIKARLEWWLTELMRVEVEARVGAPKGEHSRERKTNYSGYRVRRVRMFISDAHQGIQAAVKKEWLGASWQRCKVHFMRNILARVAHKDKAPLAERLKQIWLQPVRRSAERLAELIIKEYEEKYPEAMRCLEEGLEDSLQFYNFPEIDKRRISSTNVLERTNREIRRRSRVVGVFSSIESYLRLVTAYLIEYTEDWANENAYIKADKLGPLLEQELAQAAN
ncbi:MAG: transposase [Candidatus Aminicenantes bacterium]|nr:transposase [Candidatus Aminicenantes bacterium]